MLGEDEIVMACNDVIYWGMMLRAWIEEPEEMSIAK
jgi:hypothetical protein